MSANNARNSSLDEKVSILVVDDRADKLLAYEVMLADLSENIVCVRSGKEALRQLLQKDFAAILLDVNMPGMDGFETAALIRQRQRCEATPIIFVSAINDTVNHISRGYSLGAVDYILTPIVPEILRTKIAVFVDLFKKTEQVKQQAEERTRLIREQTARAEAERANLAKDQFLAMLSHELRTPLTPVLTSVIALEEENELPEKFRESLQMIRRNIELEARLIDDLLDLTRISKGKVQLNLEIVEADTLLRNALEVCQAEIDKKHLRLQVDLSAQKVRLKADSARLQQIFWNIIKNAVKFTPKGGQIHIRTSNDSGDRLQVEVTDTGLGIDSESMPKVFEAFEQGESIQRGGLGLGLAISKALVEAHKGTITAKSAGRNKGSTFTVLFPTSTEATVAAKPIISPRLPERQSRRVLLVEDHEDTNHALTNLLRRSGYHVHSANSVQSALDLAANQEFDVLISDLGLPDGSGIDLMRKLNSGRPLLAIALTGYGTEDDIRKSYDGGFSHHLVKPIDVNKLDLLIQQGVVAAMANGDFVTTNPPV
jgi:signal transduction histidine kinase